MKEEKLKLKVKQEIEKIKQLPLEEQLKIRRRGQQKLEELKYSIPNLEEKINNNLFETCPNLTKEDKMNILGITAVLCMAAGTPLAISLNNPYFAWAVEVVCAGAGIAIPNAILNQMEKNNSTKLLHKLRMRLVQRELEKLQQEKFKQSKIVKSLKEVEKVYWYELI